MSVNNVISAVDVKRFAGDETCRWAKWRSSLESRPPRAKVTSERFRKHPEEGSGVRAPKEESSREGLSLVFYASIAPGEE